LFEKIGVRWRHVLVDEFDVRGHARLIGNVLIALALLAFVIALAGLLPEHIFQIPPHFFGNGGAALVGLVCLAVGLWLRK
jgi:hypothetical protein